MRRTRATRLSQPVSERDVDAGGPDPQAGEAGGWPEVQEWAGPVAQGPAPLARVPPRGQPGARHQGSAGNPEPRRAAGGYGPPVSPARYAGPTRPVGPGGVGPLGPGLPGRPVGPERYAGPDDPGVGVDHDDEAEPGWWVTTPAGADRTAVLDGLDGLDDDDPYAYGRARLPAPEPAARLEPTGLHLAEKWEATRHWLAAATGLNETEPGLDRAFRLVEVGIAFVFFWFGFLKLLPGVSPAEDLAGRTIATLTFHAVAPRTGVFGLGLFEVTLAGCLWLFSGNRWVLGAVWAHLCATFLPFVVHPGLAFGGVPGRLSATGQALVLNLVLLAAVWALIQYHQLWPLRDGPADGDDAHRRWLTRPGRGSGERA